MICEDVWHGGRTRTKTYLDMKVLGGDGSEKMMKGFEACGYLE